MTLIPNHYRIYYRKVDVFVGLVVVMSGLRGGCILVLESYSAFVSCCVVSIHVQARLVRVHGCHGFVTVVSCSISSKLSYACVMALWFMLRHNYTCIMSIRPIASGICCLRVRTSRVPRMGAYTYSNKFVPSPEMKHCWM
jgi:hypothetical protein